MQENGNHHSPLQTCFRLSGFTPTLPASEDFTLEFTTPEAHNLGLFTITETQCINEPRGFLNDSAIPKNVSVSRT